MNNLNKILKQIRIFSYLNQAQLSDKISLSRSYISQIEAGKKTPSMKILEKYAKTFDIPLAAIMIFADDYENKKDWKNKTKALLTKNTVKFLEWISEGEK